jgi:predicted nuclease of predicted toxin-antitoxin system
MPEKIKLYLDQMLQAHVARILSDEGFDVLRASETGQSRADDEQIMEKAIDDNRILITLDEHFGDWAILPLSRHPGVIRLKVNPTTSENILRVLLPFLRRLLPDKIENRLVILSSSREKWISTA